jgi:hypothetical protein
LAGGQKSKTDENNDPRAPESLEEQLDHAAKELITGDSDDPPLSEEAVLEMIRVLQMPKGPGL